MTVPNAHVHFGLDGFYKLVAHRINSTGDIISSRDCTGWFGNLITDLGLDSIGYCNGSSPSFKALQGCIVGDGTTPPSFSDTSMESPVAATNTLNGTPSWGNQISALPYYVYFRISYRFGVGAAAGNLTEVGLGTRVNNVSTDSNVFSRSLIKDSEGNPVTITILSDEILDVYYELRAYPIVTSTGTFSIDVLGTPTDFDYTLRPVYMNQPQNGLGNFRWHVGNNNSPWISANGSILNTYAYTGTIDTTVTNAPSGTSSGATSKVASAYTLGNLYQDIVCTWDTSAANFEIQSFVFGIGTSWGDWKMQISPTLTKTNLQVLTITVRTSWGRFSP